MKKMQKDKIIISQNKCYSLFRYRLKLLADSLTSKIACELRGRNWQQNVNEKGINLTKQAGWIKMDLPGSAELVSNKLYIPSLIQSVLL